MRAPIRLLSSSLLGLLLAACQGPGGGGEDVAEGALSLRIESPARGSLTGAAQVVVRGQVLGAQGAAEVTVNGAPAERLGDGRFEATVALKEGTNLIETAAGEVTDVRAVLRGELAPAIEPAAGAVVLRLTPEAVSALGESGEALADALLQEFAGADEPVATFGVDCFGADLYLERIEAADLVIEPRLAEGGLAFDVEVHDVSATLSAHYSFLCAESTSEVLLSAGLLAASAQVQVSEGGASGIEVEVIDLATQVEGLSLDGGDLPEDFDADVESAVEGFFDEQVAEIVPSLVEDALAGLQTSAELELGDSVLRLGIAPTDVSFTEERGLLVAQSTVEVDGHEGTSYLSTPRPVPEAGAAGAFGAAVADDLFDQLLGAIWSAGVLELDVDATGDYALLETVGADHAELRLPLPPTIAPTEDGVPTVTLGDLDLRLTRGGALVAHLAISVQMELELGLRDGELELSPGEPSIWITLVDKGGAFGERELDIVRELADALLSQGFALAQGGLPLPEQLGALVGSPEITTGGGYVFLGGDAP